jgi:hypothetical protein
VPAPEVAAERYTGRQGLARAAAAAGVELWQQVNPANLLVSWSGLVGRLLVVLRAAQLAAASGADEYVDAALAAQGRSVSAAGRVSATAFSGIASDGRPLESLLQEPVVVAKTALARGATMPRALASGQASLEMILRTQVADAGRVADGVAVAARPRVGYVRLVHPPACGRCIVLAGRWYRYDAAFERHPQCDCTQIPAAEDTSDDFRTDPEAYFGSLSEEEQDKAFTKAGARAIRDGANIGQVVNARRRAWGLAPAAGRLTAGEKAALRSGRLQRRTVFGQDVFVTAEGTSRRGIAGQRLGGQTPRLMPESIYELAKDRDDAVRLLRRFGYII